MEFLSNNFKNISIELDKSRRILWCKMKPIEYPCFTPELLNELNVLYASINDLSNENIFNYVIQCSELIDIYSYGGNLELFVKYISENNENALYSYAKLCIDCLYYLVSNFNNSYTTIALAQGDALGGGCEMLLANDIIIAEEHSKFGFPEILFNLFPGMGAYSFLSRKVGQFSAENIIFSGKIYSAKEFKTMGIIDYLVPKHEGKFALYDLLSKSSRKFQAKKAIYESRHIINPVTYKELLEITSKWVKAAMKLSTHDLRKMRKLARMQKAKINKQKMHFISNSKQVVPL